MKAMIDYTLVVFLEELVIDYLTTFVYFVQRLFFYEYTRRRIKMSKEVIIACDFNSQEKALEFLQQFQDEKPYVKVGMEVFYGNGPEIVRQIKKQGHKIFRSC